MATKAYVYRGHTIVIDLFPKAEGTYAWGFEIDSGGCIGPEGVRTPSSTAAIAEATAAAERYVDGMAQRNHGRLVS